MITEYSISNKIFVLSIWVWLSLLFSFLNAIPGVIEHFTEATLLTTFTAFLFIKIERRSKNA